MGEEVVGSWGLQGAKRLLGLEAVVLGLQLGCGVLSGMLTVVWRDLPGGDGICLLGTWAF